VARKAIAHFESHGVPEVELRKCRKHGPDGTNLENCLKVYLPQGEPKPRFRMVFFPQLRERPYELLYLAFGVAHPPPGSHMPSVYFVAHRRLHGPPSWIVAAT